VACGARHSLLLTSAGRLVAFGSYRSGQLGLGDRADRHHPALLASPTLDRRSALEGGKESNAKALDAFIDARRESWKKDGGAGLVVLAEPTSSPSMLDAKARLMKAFPKATWASWCAVNDDSSLAGTAAAFGTARRVHPKFDQAEVILSLDCDFLHEDINAVANSRAWAAARSLVKRDNGKLVAKDASAAAMSRVYQVEGILTLTGMNADQRIAMQSLERPSIRSAIEDILTKFAGHKVLVKFELREDLQSHELVIEGDSHQTNTPDSRGSAPASSSNAAAVSPPPPLAIDEAEFQNDPLIKEALRLFEARITKKIQ
jgi:hypothetical protein